MTIDIDANRSGPPLEPVWAFFGYDEANYTTTSEGRELLEVLSTSQASIVRTRTHFLFNTGDGTPALKWGSTNLYTESDAGEPVYDYSLIDGILDATTDAGVFPLFELGFMPQALSVEPVPYENSGTSVLDSGSFHPPTDYEKWGALVAEYAEHARVRYAGSQTNWMWELWNEPDIGYWKGTFEEYARLYDHTESALHGILPEAPLGGPAIVRPDGDFLQQFLLHCASGTNAVGGGTGTRLDFVTFHAKGGTTLVGGVQGHVQLDLGNQLRLHQAGFSTIAASAFASRPVIISEADPDGCAACPSTTARHLDYRNSPAYGAYVAAMMKRSLDLAEQMEIDLQGVLTWAFTFPGTPYFAGYRALSTNGVHLPVLNAFKLLGQLQGREVEAHSSAAAPTAELIESGVRGEADIDALAAVDGNRIRILVWNYHDDLVPAEPAEVSLRVTLPESFTGGAVASHQRVDDSHGNAFTVWQSMGSPAEPSVEQLNQLKVAMNALEFEPEQELGVDNGEVTLRFSLPRFGVSLVTLRPAEGAGTDPAPPRDGCSCRTGAYASAHAKRRSLFVSTLIAGLLAAFVARRRIAAVRRTHVRSLSDHSRPFN